MTGAAFLRWRLLDDGGTQIGGTVTYLDDEIGLPGTLGGEFDVEQLQEIPMIISNISFTAQSSINGYTIRCGDGTNNEDLVVSGVYIIIVIIVHNYISYSTSACYCV